MSRQSSKKELPARPSAQGEDASSWIAEVSHELRLPIANLKLLIETLLEGACEDPAMLKRMLLRSAQEVERLQHLVVDLLSVEQVSSSLHDLRCEQVLFAERASYCIETLKNKASSAQIALEMEVAPNFSIYANPEQLDQVLLNLIENAVKFTPAGGVVTIKSGQTAGSLSVSDTGIGMPANEIPKIFQRFYRIDRAAFRGSTGLGLSIVKHIADLHGAKISVSSEEGCGSTFLLEFPVSHRSFEVSGHE